MLRLYVGLLFVGIAAAAHASEAKGGKVLTPQPVQTTTRLARSVSDFLSPNKLDEDSVVLNHTNVVATEDEVLGGYGLGNTPGSLSISEPEQETALATEARWSNNESGKRFYSLARHKRVEFNVEQYKVTLRRDSALIETGPIKVGLRTGSTSLQWTKTL